MSTATLIFDDLIGQPHAARFLSAVINQGQSSHAYLFLGPRGVGKLAAARRLAAALCCEQGGCGVCPTCVKAARDAHPDIQIITPPGAFITVDQVREVNSSLSLRPFESQARVFIFRDAGSFNAESANAFLKSLEEPPAFVYFILLAPSEDRLLATLVSRCQPVRFNAVPVAEIEAYLLANCQARPAEARAYALIAAGSLDLAIELCQDDAMAQRRRHYIQIGDNLCRGAWEGGAAGMVAEITSAAEAKAQAATDAGPGPDIPEGFITLPKKRQEEDARRLGAQARRRELNFALDVLESWFRDLLVMGAGAGDAVLNKDYELELEDRALPSRLASYRQALQAIAATRGKLGYNVDMELALQAMFFKLQEVL
ncbi:MAG: DNA polymerase III subunit delta' [Thermoleophilia bacterium]